MTNMQTVDFEFDKELENLPEVEKLELRKVALKIALHSNLDKIDEAQQSIHVLKAKNQPQSFIRTFERRIEEYQYNVTDLRSRLEFLDKKIHLLKHHS